MPNDQTLLNKKKNRLKEKERFTLIKIIHQD
jgi:hypothetical protein